MKVAVVTDTHSGITNEEAKELGIYLINAPFMVNGKQHYEGIDLDHDSFYRMLDDGADVSTSQSSPADILKLWDGLLEEYDEVVIIPLSSGLSGGYQTMVALSCDDKYEGRVFPVDKLGVSITERRAALDAKKLADNGYGGAEIKRILEEHRKENLIYITVPTLKYLKKGGRVTPAAAALGTLLKIKPVLIIDGDKLDAFAKARTMAKACDIMLEAAQTALTERLKDPSGEDSRIYSVHSQNMEQAESFAEEIKKRWPKAEISVDELPLAIACHTGPGALAIAVERKLSEAESL